MFQNIIHASSTGEDPELQIGRGYGRTVTCLQHTRSSAGCTTFISVSISLGSLLNPIPLVVFNIYTKLTHFKSILSLKINTVMKVSYHLSGGFMSIILHKYELQHSLKNYASIC